MTRARYKTDEVGESAGCDAADAWAEHGFLKAVLIEPDDGMRAAKLVGQGNEALQRPAFVGTAGTGVDDDAAMRFTAKCREIWRGDLLRQGGLRQTDEQCLGDAPILLRSGIGLRQKYAMMQQCAEMTTGHMRADAMTRAAEPGEQMGDIALVVAEQTCARPQGADMFDVCGESGGMTPGAVEVGGDELMHLNLRTGDAVERCGGRSGGDDDAPVGMLFGKLLDDGQEHDVVAQLVHFKDEQRHG